MTMTNNRGKFITIEGTEGVGKSTNIEFIKQYFVQKNIPLTITREPGGTPLAEEVRDLLLKNRSEKMDETAELLLVFAARAQHIENVILPALDCGNWVLCDRFTDATYAYQGGGRGLSLSLIKELEKKVQKGLQPDLTFLLDIDVKAGLERAAARAALDRFEQEKVEFFERVREAYLSRASDNPQRFFVVDARQPLTKVQSTIKEFLDQFLA